MLCLRKRAARGFASGSALMEGLKCDMRVLQGTNDDFYQTTLTVNFPSPMTPAVFTANKAKFLSILSANLPGIVFNIQAPIAMTGGCQVSAIVNQALTAVLQTKFEAAATEFFMFVLGGQEYTTNLSIQLPLLQAWFTSVVQQQYLQAVAAALGLAVGKVAIQTITAGAGFITVVTVIKSPTVINITAQALLAKTQIINFLVTIQKTIGVVVPMVLHISITQFILQMQQLFIQQIATALKINVSFVKITQIIAQGTSISVILAIQNYVSTQILTAQVLSQMSVISVWIKQLTVVQSVTLNIVVPCTVVNFQTIKQEYITQVATVLGIATSQVLIDYITVYNSTSCMVVTTVKVLQALVASLTAAFLMALLQAWFQIIIKRFGNPCAGVYCGNGQCVGGKCQCNSGWTGAQCTQKVDPCAGVNCGHGQCVGGQCQCYSGWTGAQCNQSASGGQCTSGAPMIPEQGGTCGPGRCCPIRVGSPGTAVEGKMECCSQWGWCGISSAHCGTGCNPAYGRCGAPWV